ncbi:MAG: FAD-dependent oxidoreductase [Rhizonema sp. PD38]|nr:FAD-dependent oxidoreductase [Rhizonema sp. PD38]
MLSTVWQDYTGVLRSVLNLPTVKIFFLGVFFKDVGQLWSAKLVAAIASQCIQQGANIQTQTEVYEVQKEFGC